MPQPKRQENKFKSDGSVGIQANLNTTYPDISLNNWLVPNAGRWNHATPKIDGANVAASEEPSRARSEDGRTFSELVQNVPPPSSARIAVVIGQLEVLGENLHRIIGEGCFSNRESIRQAVAMLEHYLSECRKREDERAKEVALELREDFIDRGRRMQARDDREKYERMKAEKLAAVREKAAARRKAKKGAKRAKR